VYKFCDELNRKKKGGEGRDKVTMCSENNNETEIRKSESEKAESLCEVNQCLFQTISDRVQQHIMSRQFRE